MSIPKNYTAGNPIKVNLTQMPKQEGFQAGGDYVGRFPTELGSGADGINRMFTAEGYQAINQGGLAAIGNSLVQLGANVIADVVSTPGYVYSGLNNLITKQSEFDNWFINVGESIKDFGKDIAPIYQSDESKLSVFDPTNSEWWANSIQGFGSTIALLGTAYFTGGLATPRIIAGLSKLGQAVGAAEATINALQKGGQLYNFINKTNMVLTSRLIESGMEGKQVFDETYQRVLAENPGISENYAKSLASEAARDTWINNLPLAALDFIEFDALTKGFSAFGVGKRQIIRGLTGVAISEVAPEALEEGIQYAITKEAENDVQRKLGKTNVDTTIFDEFINGFEDVEMRQAMVQGALGGGVFASIGSVLERISNRGSLGQTYQELGMPHTAQKQKYTELKDQLIAKPEDVTVRKAQLEVDVNNEDLTEAQRYDAKEYLDVINHYEAVEQSLAGMPVDKKSELLSNNVDAYIAEKTIKNINEEIQTNFANSEKTVTSEIKKKLSKVISKNKLNKDDFKDLFTKLDTKLGVAVDVEEIGSKKPVLDKLVDQLARELVSKQIANNNIKQINSNFNSFKETKVQEETKIQKVKEKNKLESLATLNDLLVEKSKGVNIDEEVEKRSRQELENVSELPSSNEEILNYYSDKPYTLYKEMGFKSLGELEATLNNQPIPQGESNVEESQISLDTNKFKQYEVGKKYNINNKQQEYIGRNGTQLYFKDENNNVDEVTHTSFDVDLVPEKKYESPDIPNMELTYLESDENGHTFTNNIGIPFKLPIGSELIPIKENNFPKQEKTPQTEVQANKQVKKAVETNTKKTNEIPFNIDQELPFEQETPEPIEKTLNNNIRTYDKALFQLETRNGVQGIFISNSEGGFVPMDKAKELYTIPKKLINGKFYTLKDKEGNPIDSSYLTTFDDYDVDFVRDFASNSGGEVFLEIDKNKDFNKKENVKFHNALIEFVTYPNGNRKVVGVAKSVNYDEVSPLAELRKVVFEASKNSTDILFQYPNKVNLTTSYGGKINTTSDRNKRISPSAILKEGEEMILGVSYSTPDGVTRLITNKEDLIVTGVNTTPGYTYLITKDLQGKHVPVRLYTKAVKEVENLKRQLLQAINKIDLEKAKSIVKFNVNGKSVPDFNADIKKNFTKKIITGSQNNPVPAKYKDGTILDIIKPGAILVTATGQNVGVTKISDGNITTIPLDEDFNRMEAPERVQPLNTETLSQYSVHYAYNYYAFYELGDHPAQIDNKLINTSNYNTAIANDRLLTDLIPGQRFHSPLFAIDFNSFNVSQETTTQRNQETQASSETQTEKQDIILTIGANDLEIESQIENKENISDSPNNNETSTTDSSVMDFFGFDKFKLKDSKQSYVKWNSTFELAKVKQMLPNVPVHVVDNIGKVIEGGHDAWGVMHNASIYLVENAQEGTALHESFHAVFNYLLDDKQQTSLLNDIRKEYKNESLTDLEAEEILADKFAEYVKVRQTNTKLSLSQKIAKFFSELYDTLKYWLTNTYSVESLFYQIDKGYFANKTFKRSIESVKPKFSRNKFFAPKEYENVLSFTANLLDAAIQTEKELNSSKSISAILKQLISTGEDSLFFSKSIPHSLVNQLRTKFNNYSAEDKQKYGSDFSRYINALTEVKDNTVIPRQLFYDSIRHLSTRGYMISPDAAKFLEVELAESETMDEESLQTYEEDFREAWQEGNFSYSAIEKLGERLRFKLNSIPKIEWQNNEAVPVIGYLGFPAVNEVNYAYHQLQNVIGGSSSVEHMMSKLQEASLSNPLMKYVLDNLVNNDEVFKGELYIYAAQLNHPEFVLTLQRKNNSGGVETRIIPANSNTQINIITENIASNFVENSEFYSEVNGEVILNQDKAKQIVKQIENFVVKLTNEVRTSKPEIVAAKYGDEYFNLVTSFGININKEALDNSLLDPKTAKKLFKHFTNQESTTYSFVYQIAKGEDPIEKSNDGVRRLVKLISKEYPVLTQDAHRKSSGGKVYEWIRANFLGRAISQLTSSEFSKNFFESRANDPYYRNLPLFQILTDKDESDVQLSPEDLRFEVFSEMKLSDETSLEYSDMSLRHLYIQLLSAYQNQGNGDYTLIPMPVHSDAGVMTGLRVKKIRNQNFENGKKGILDYLVDSAFHEIVRIKLGRTGIKNQNANKNKFIFFEELNDKGLLDYDINNESDVKQLRSKLATEIRNWLNKIYNQELKNLKELKIVEEKEGQLFFTDKLLNNVSPRQFLIEFIPNFIFYQQQFIALFNGDISYYKSIGDFFKRAKQIWSPVTFGDNTVLPETRQSYNVKYIKDNEGAFQASEIIANLEKLYGNIEDATRIGENFKKVNETDGQSLIDPYRYREQELMLHRWNDAKEKAYRRLIKGETLGDSQIIFTVRKPFYYGFHLKDNEVHPVQNKSSEYIITPSLGLKSNPNYNEAYRTMLEDMGYTFNDQDNSVTFDQVGRDAGKYTDMFSFESAVKVGLYGESDKVSEALSHKYSNSTWGLQMETPIHHIEDEIPHAVQQRKHMINDLELNDTKSYITPIGENLSGNQVLEEYNQIIIENIKEDFNNLAEEFGNDIEKFVQRLREEVITRRLGNQYLEALDLIKDDNGEWITKLPLFHPLHAYRIESLLNSLFKNNVTRQKLENAATYANLSSYGFTNKPKIVFNNDGSIAHYEALIPISDKRIFSFLEKNFKNQDGTWNLDKANKLYPDLFKGTFWRIPNEEKYSTFHIKVIGFLPTEAGGAIVLPPEVTTIAGLDFDIDKLYGFFYNATWINGIPEFKRDNSREGRHNRLQDLMWAVMTSKKAAKSILNPGGFATIEKMVNEITKAKSISREDHNVTLPSTWSNVASRMLTGEALIGVAANANSAHAIFQLAPLLQTKISFNFNQEKEIDLNKQLSKSGKDITRNIAEYLAAFVDNGKNPLAKYININSYTIDVAMSMLLLGIDIPTVSYYLSQPALVDLADKYLSFGANNKAENKALRELSAKYKTNFFKNKQLDSTVNFNDQELKEGLTKSNDNFNIDLINSFLVYKRQAKAITNLVNASKVSESGAGATNADTLFKLNTIEQAINSELLVGQEFVLNNPNLFSTELNNVMRDTLTTIANNTDMPDLTSGSFKLLNDFLLEFKSDTGVSAKDLDFMVKNFMDYLATSIIKFDNELIKELPKRLLKISKSSNSKIIFEEEQTSGYRNRTIKNASADATIALAVDFDSAGEKLTKSSVINQGKKYIPINANNLEVTPERVDKIVDILNSINKKEVPVANIPQNLVSGVESFGTKQEAQQLYSSYLETTSNPTIEGFKQWYNRQQQINELFESNSELANAVYEALDFNFSKINVTDSVKDIFADDVLKNLANKYTSLFNNIESITTTEDLIKKLEPEIKNIQDKYSVYSYFDKEKNDFVDVIKYDNRTEEDKLIQNFYEKIIKGTTYVSGLHTGIINAFIINTNENEAKAFYHRFGINKDKLIIVINNPKAEYLKAGIIHEAAHFFDNIEIKITNEEVEKIINQFEEIAKQKQFGTIGFKNPGEYLKMELEKGNNKEIIPVLAQLYELQGSTPVKEFNDKILPLFQITPQQKQQAQQLYSQYLDQIFPDSKVKDIVYHGSKSKFEKFDKSKLGNNTNPNKEFPQFNDSYLGFHFTSNPEYYRGRHEFGSKYEKNLNEYIVILDIKKPKDIADKDEFSQNNIQFIKPEDVKNNDSIIYDYLDTVHYEKGNIYTNNYVVFEPEQIHILGSKQDIEGFKEFVNKPNQKSSSITNEDIKPGVTAFGVKQEANSEAKEISLNIAGNGIYTMKGKYTQDQIDEFTYQLLKAVVESPKLKNKIGSIRTGGQTGFDEAGAKAGIKLGIPVTVLAPKGWKFRNISGQDISNEQQFKSRFSTGGERIDSTFLSRLGVEVDAKGRSFIMYNGVNGQDKIIIDRIREDWESLLLSEDSNLRKLATDLVQYAFMMSGFRITPLSFSHLQPVKFYTDSEVGRNLNKYLRSVIKQLEVNSDTDLVANFIDQFTRNHFSNLNYIPAASYGIDDFPNVSSIDYINGKAKDRNALPYIINIERDNYDFFVRGNPVPYIKYDHFGTNYLFKLDEDTIMYGTKGGVKSASYYPVTSLGINKKKGTIRSKFFTEYDIDSRIINSNFGENNKVNKAIDKYKEEFKFVEEAEVIMPPESENFQEIKAWFKINMLNLTDVQLDEMTRNNISNLNEIFDMPETPENIGLLHMIKCMS